MAPETCSAPPATEKIKTYHNGHTMSVFSTETFCNDPALVQPIFCSFMIPKIPSVASAPISSCQVYSRAGCANRFFPPCHAFLGRARCDRSPKHNESVSADLLRTASNQNTPALPFRGFQFYSTTETQNTQVRRWSEWSRTIRHCTHLFLCLSSLSHFSPPLPSTMVNVFRELKLPSGQARRSVL